MNNVAEFRLTNFREFPYLYEGDLKYEQEYLSAFATHSHSLLVAAFDNDTLVGISTGFPLQDETDFLADLKQQLQSAHQAVEPYFYFAEDIISTDHRGQGIYSKIIELREAKAQQWGFTKGCFLAVIRDDAHPLKPENYQNPDSIFTAKGYTKTNTITTLEWPTLQNDGSVINQTNSLCFWEKVL